MPLDVISRGKPAARKYVDALPERWVISQVSALEIIVGARDKRDLANMDAFLSACMVVPLGATAGTRAYELLRLGTQSLTGYPSSIRWWRPLRSKRI